VKHCKNEYPLLYSCMHMAVSQLRQLSVDFSSQRPRFNPRAVQVGYMVNKVAFKQVFSEYFIFPLSIKIPLHIYIYHMGLVQLDHYETQCQVTHPVSNHPTHKMVNLKNITQAIHLTL